MYIEFFFIEIVFNGTYARFDPMDNQTADFARYDHREG